MQPEINLRTIYVALLDEGADCWRPAEARPESGDVFTRVSSNESDGNEKWQFECGDRVRCVKKTLSVGTNQRTVLVAVSRA